MQQLRAQQKMYNQLELHPVGHLIADLFELLDFLFVHIYGSLGHFFEHSNCTTQRTQLLQDSDQINCTEMPCCQQNKCETMIVNRQSENAHDLVY